MGLEASACRPVGGGGIQIPLAAFVGRPHVFLPGFAGKRSAGGRVAVLRSFPVFFPAAGGGCGAGAALAARQAAEAAAKAAARAAGTAIAAERSKRNKRCAELYREKSEAKKEARGSSCRDMIIPECPTQSECNAFNDRYEKMKRFAEARKAYDDECHQGGDKGHQEQSKGWNEGAQNCKNKYDEGITKLNKLI